LNIDLIRSDSVHRGRLWTCSCGGLWVGHAEGNGLEARRGNWTHI